jgi:AcrR family transcriptional regulator
MYGIWNELSPTPCSTIRPSRMPTEVGLRLRALLAGGRVAEEAAAVAPVGDEAEAAPRAVGAVELVMEDDPQAGVAAVELVDVLVQGVASPDRPRQGAVKDYVLSVNLVHERLVVLAKGTHEAPRDRSLTRHRTSPPRSTCKVLSRIMTLSQGPTRVRRRRLTRAERQDLTRSHLLDAALHVCARRGIHGAGVEEIADRAGYSTGAIYSNFDGKEGLLLALFEERLEPRIRELAAPLIDAPTAAEQAEAVAEFTRGLLDEERQYLLLLCEFWSYAARSARLRRRFARVRRDRRAAIETMIE